MLEQARHILDTLWSQVSHHGVSLEDMQKLPTEIVKAIDRSVNSKTKTYRYVLPTQLLAKLTNLSLDCRAIQEGAALKNAFDARSLCHAVVVPFDRTNHNVLGGSTEPYVNNPLRIPSITQANRKPQKDKAGFDDLCVVLDHAQQHPQQAKLLMTVVLSSIRTRLSTTQVVYPVPNRVSLHAGKSVITSFLESRTGGFRLQTVAIALFKTIGQRLGLFHNVSSAAVNASDASTGLVADLTCVDGADQIVLAVEVKDRKLTLRHVQDKLTGVRERGIRELLFLVQGGVADQDRDGIRESIDREFSLGQNIYVCEFDTFLECCLVLFGENSRREFFLNVGKSLDDLRADLVHREAWRDLLSGL